MIRSFTRLGLVTAGSGGNAGDYAFDADGLSNDPRLAQSLESLTPAQLQSALDGKDPSADLLDLLHQDITGTGAGSLPCGAQGSTCGPAAAPIPTWVWIAGAAAGALLLMGVTRR